jgi:hypothetical protein
MQDTGSTPGLSQRLTATELAIVLYLPIRYSDGQCGPLIALLQAKLSISATTPSG